LSRRLAIIKIGGSVITDKERIFTPRIDVINGIARELSNALNNWRIVLIHGAGSFGHPLAYKYGLHLGFKDRNQIIGVAETKLSMIRLSEIVVESLVRHGVSAVPMYPMDFMVMTDFRISRVFIEPIKMLLSLDITPVICGDTVLDVKHGFGILSGDQIASRIASEIGADRVVFGTDVDGVYTSDPKKSVNAKLIDTITPSSFSEVIKFVGCSTSSDVTQGMLGKLREALILAEKGIQVVIGNMLKYENLRLLLDGNTKCTRIIPNELQT